MVAGLANRLNILNCSPHDENPAQMYRGVSSDNVEHWVPSRYNVRAKAEDGRLVLWNTLRGSMVVFQAKDRERVVDLLKPNGFEAPRQGTVAYLVRQGFLVRRGVDEYRQFQMIFGRQHNRTDVLELILMASEDCNFRCQYCYEDFARGTMIPEVREGVKKLVLERLGTLRHLSISWFGGEPLYGFEAIEDLAPFFRDTAEQHGQTYSSHMTTNGYLLTPDVAEKLLAWKINRFQITIDGLAEDHDHNRPTREGEGTFERISSNLESLSRRADDFHVTLRVNYDAVNATRMTELLDYFKERFAGDSRFQVSFHAVGKWGGPNDAQLEVCGKDDAVKVKQNLLAEARARGLSLPTLKDVSTPGAQVCYAARPYNFLIGATGKVMKCTIVLDTDEKNVVGHLTPDGRIELDDDYMALWTEPAFESDGQCQKCVVLPSCQGIHCPLIRIDQDTQPCISTRKYFKKELLETLEDVPGRRVSTVADG